MLYEYDYSKKVLMCESLEKKFSSSFTINPLNELNELERTLYFMINSVAEIPETAQ